MRYDNKIQHLIISMLFTLAAGLAAADDTEVYLAAPSQSTLLPNVLFMLDTSGSMTSVDSGQSKNRLELMKDALRSVIGSANNVKMGLMRFHKEGGPVLYPVADINAPAESAAGGQGDVVSIISSSSDDAEQLVSSGSVSLDATLLSMTTSVGSIVNEEFSVSDGNDDAEEEVSNGDMSRTSSDLELMSDDGDMQKIGVHFRTTNIPAGAKILSAEIEFQIKDRPSGNDSPIGILINGHKATNSSSFSNSDGGISDRITAGTLASVTWNPDAGMNTGELLSTPDLSPLLQEMVDQAGWDTNKAATFLLQQVSGSGVRRVWSHNGSGAAPKLKVSYATGASGDQTVGLRFRNIMVPKGATITNAVLEFEAASSLSDQASFVIAAEDGDNPDTFAATLNNISSRTPTTASVAWGDATAGVESWVTGQRFQSPDLSSVVQEIVNRDGWCGGNAMVLTISGAANALRTATAYDGNASAAPTLRLTYDPDTVPTDTCINQQIQAAVNSSNSDAEEKADNSMYLDSSDLELVHDGGEQLIGIRFANIQIPKDTTIVSADIVFTVDETSSGATSLTLHGEAVDDSDEFTNSSGNISIDRTTTTASVSWSPDPWNTQGEQHASPDLSSIVAEITSRPGWAAGNAMTFIIQGSGERIAEAYDGDAAAAPRLRIMIQGSQGESGLQVQTVRDKLIEVVDNLNYKSGTPILDVMYEAARYYRGEAVHYGRTRGFGYASGDGTLGDQSSSRSEYTRVSTPLSWTGGTLVQPEGCSDDNPNSNACIDEYISGEATYISPVTEHCQANYQIVLSDGQGYGTNSVDLVNAMIDDDSSNCSGHDGCAEDLSRFLYTADQNDLPNDQNVTTHTIGFALDGDPQFLRNIASEGGGSFFEAESSAGLVDVFQTILTDVLSRSTSFTAAAVSVNQFENLSHDDDIYFSTFEPSGTRRWIGNLKKYKICQGAAGDTCTVGDIIDEDGESALTSDNYFAETAKDFWSQTSATDDGNQVDAGGAGGRIVFPRKIYTNRDGGTSGVTLNTAENRIEEADITTMDTTLSSLLSPGSDQEYLDVVNWILGKDIQDEDEDSDTTDNRWAFSDSLHSRPLVVTYGKEADTDDAEGKTIKKIFIGTNDGLLRSINSETGQEEWAFMPQAMLSQQVQLMHNANGEHIYGIDNDITSWTKDVDGDGIIEPASGDLVYLFFGMRRGGRNIYALNVTPGSTLTNAESTSGIVPRLLWKIEGGTTTGFESLGQSWSNPVPTKLFYDGQAKDVLIFAGGYHPDQDTAFGTSSYGNAVYVVDMETGGLLWWASGTDSGATLELAGMNYPIPADVTLMDADGDNITDRLYVGDTGGQVWRIDFANASGGMSGSGAMLASISSDASDADKRKFFYSPDVTQAYDANFSTVAAYDLVTIASGDRANPVATSVHDKIYAFRDYAIHGPIDPPDNDSENDSDSNNFQTLVEADLYDASDNRIQDADGQYTDADEVDDLKGKPGWLVNLDYIDSTTTGWVGEKSLAKTTILNGVLFVTTYLPDGSVDQTDICGAVAEGAGRLYGLNIFTAGAVYPAWFGLQDQYHRGDRVYGLQSGIPTEFVPIFIPTPEGTVVKGNVGGGGGSTEIDPDIILEGTRTFWFEPH